MPAVSPASPEGWQELVGALYDRRARAFASGSAEPLAEVYAPRSSLRSADAAHLARLRADGEVLRGFAPEVVRVTGVDRDEARVRLTLVDRWPAYDVVPAGDPAGPALRSLTARGAADVQMVLVRTQRGWLIESAERLT